MLRRPPARFHAPAAGFRRDPVARLGELMVFHGGSRMHYCVRGRHDQVLFKNRTAPLPIVCPRRPHSLGAQAAPVPFPLLSRIILYIFSREEKSGNFSHLHLSNRAKEGAIGTGLHGLIPEQPLLYMFPVSVRFCLGMNGKCLARPGESEHNNTNSCCCRVRARANGYQMWKCR